MVLASKLKFLRRKIGLSQMELAEKLGVSRQAISSWEAGASRPSVDNLQCLSKLYNIPLEVLLDDTAEAEPLAETPVNKAVDVQNNFAWNAKRRVVGIAAFLIALVAIIVMIIILKNTGEVTDINEIPGERVELDSGGIILEW